MSQRIKRLCRKLLVGTLLLGLVFVASFFKTAPATAATGVNQQINFQGRLLNSQGAVVPDGYYNIEFKVYQDGDGQSAGDTTGTPAGTLLWTEDYLNANTQAAEVQNGYLSVQLGSLCSFSGGSCQGHTNAGVNWNSDTLWLSMNIAGTTSCTPFSSCSPDGEMIPMKRLSANAYALNAGQLGGLASNNFVQIAHGAQIDSSTSSSVYINKTGASGNILELQKAGIDVLSVNNSGALALGQAGSSGQNGKLVFSTTNASSTAITLQAAATASSYTLTLPTLGPSTSQCLQTAASDSTQLVFGACGATGTFLSKNSTDTSTADAGSGYLYTFTNSGSSGTGGVLSLDNGNNTGTVLNVKGTSSNAFQVQNSSGHRVLGVDTSGNQTVLGQSSQLNGTLVFKNSNDTNSVTLNSTAANSNYSLTLPSSSPAAGLCLETSPSNANQLVFASCTNNNASIQEVHEWDANNTNTVSVSPTTVGDEMVLTTQIPTNGVSVTSISGGGATTWTKATFSAGNGTVNRVEMWLGTVATTGNSTVTVTYSSSPGAEEITATEFTAAGVNSNTSWGIESASSQLNSTASTAVTFPSMNAVNGSELYVGYAQVQNPPATAGSTSNFNYIVTSTQHNVITYDPALAANTNYQPTAIQNSSGQSNTVAAVLTAFVTSTSINNTTSIQKGNFYVQAATSGSVAGILQAASSGSADIFDLRNSGAVNVMSVGNTGATVFENSTDSSSAFQIQNHTGTRLFNVNTSSNRVELGASSSSAGMLSFNDSGDTNSITLAAPSSVAASYTLSLPTNTPTAGLCLGTSPSNANQLIFASCATQVSAASISEVNQWGNSGTSVTTIADSPASVGNLLLFYSHATNNVSVNSISGGGVTNWSKVTSNTNAGGQGNNELWRGRVTAAGASTITVTYSAAAGVNDIEAQEFTMGSSTGTWAVDTSGALASSSSTTAINYPSLTPLNSSELYAGYAWGANTMSAGTTSGFTYQATAGSKYLAFNTNVTGGTAYAPTASQATIGAWNSIAAVIAAYAGTSVIVNSTATQQANYNVQAATSGTVAGILQAATSGTADIFQAKDASGNNIAAVNAASGLTLGASGAVGGQLNFAASSNSNTISIYAPSAPASSYYLTLPSTTPAAGQCLASSPNNANQLVFSSCANQVTSVAISLVNNWKSSTVTTNPTLSVSPTNLGDLMTLFINSSKGNSVNSVSGGGVSTWSKIVGANSEEMWRGIITSTGSSTISVSVSTPSSPTEELAAQEWTTGSSNGSWVVDASGTISNSGSSTVTYPGLTPQSTKDLYVGYAIGTSTMSAGSTSGYTYFSGAGTNIYGAYNTTVSTSTQPTASQSVTGTSIAAGALIAAYSSSSVIANSTVTQEANLNVQAAANGSVAGVLQAAIGGSGDVLDVLNGSGTLTDSFSSTGNLLVKPSAASAAAFQVQTTGAVNVLSADTNGLKVVIGAGSTGENTPSLLVLDNETGTTVDPSVLNGAMYYNATTHTFRCGVDSSWQNCNSLLYSNTSQSSANNNCSNNCSAFSTAAAIPANYCQAGRVIKLSAAGYFSSQATASNLQFGVYYGTDGSVASNDALLGSLTPAASVTSASSNFFQIGFNVICFSTTSMQAEGTLGLQTGTSSAGMTLLPMSSTSGTTVVSSSAKNLYVFPIWDTANASNTATLTQFTVNSY